MKSNTQFKSKESSSEELVSAIREIPIRLIYDGCCSLENEKEGNFNYEEYLESVKNSSNYGHFLTLSCEDHFIRKFGNQFNCDGNFSKQWTTKDPVVLEIVFLAISNKIFSFLQMDTYLTIHFLL